MANLIAFLTRVIAVVLVPSLVIFLSALPVTAQGSKSNYTFLIAAGFLCEPADYSTCPAAAKSANDDSYEMSGAGTFDAQDKSVKAAGTYSHKSPNGNVLETGVWTASELVSFDSYGIAPGAIKRQGMALGPAPFGPKRMPMPAGPMPTGGLAIFRIRLLPMLGASTTAVLQVNCALGEVPRERSVEGIRLIFEKGGNEFSGEVGGRVLFLSMQLEVSPPVKAAQPEAAPGLPEPPQN